MFGRNPSPVRRRLVKTPSSDTLSPRERAVSIKAGKGVNFPGARTWPVAHLPICPSAYLPASRLDQAFLDREENQFRRAVEVEGLHEAGAVHGDCINTDIKQCSNFLIGFSLSD
jgi:hypothetical protein